MESIKNTTFKLLDNHSRKDFEFNSVIYDSPSKGLIVVSKRDLSKEEINKIEEYILQFLEFQKRTPTIPNHLNNLVKNCRLLRTQVVGTEVPEQDSKKARTVSVVDSAIRSFLQNRGYELVEDILGRSKCVLTTDLQTASYSIVVALGSFESFDVSLEYLRNEFPTIFALTNGDVKQKGVLCIAMGEDRSQKAIALAIKKYITSRVIQTLPKECLLEGIEFADMLGIKTLKTYYQNQLTDLLKNNQDITDETVCYVMQAAAMLHEGDLFNLAAYHFKNRLIAYINEFYFNKEGALFNTRLNTLRSFFKGPIDINLNFLADIPLLYINKCLPVSVRNSSTLYWHSPNYVYEKCDYVLFRRVTEYDLEIESSINPIILRDGFVNMPNIEKLKISTSRVLTNEETNFIITQLQYTKKITSLLWRDQISGLLIAPDNSEAIYKIMKACPNITSFTANSYIAEVEELLHLEHLEMHFPNLHSLQRVLEKCKGKLKSLRIVQGPLRVDAGQHLSTYIPQHLKVNN